MKRTICRPSSPANQIGREEFTKIKELKIFFSASNYGISEVGVYRRTREIFGEFVMDMPVLRRGFNGGAIFESNIEDHKKSLILATNMAKDFETLDDIFN